MSKKVKNKRKISLDKVCRACMSDRGHLREIFSTKLPKMMESCADIEVSVDDELPPYVCVSCFHLIAKFYTFKKKMERSDRFLRNHFKQSKLNKSKHKDILNIAISESEIGEIDNIIELHKDFDEDMPLSQLQKRYNPQTDPLADPIEIEATQIFSNEPPPLVPLESSKKAGTSSEDDNILKHLPENPPPLIPIKPLTNATALTNVLTENLDKIEIQCFNCLQQFDSVSALKEHKSTECQANSLKCNICRKEFRDRRKLIGHLKGHMIVKDYACNICGKRYPNPSTFKVHMRTHTGERPFKCQICGKGFVRWAGVVGHMRTHQSNKPYSCETCGKGFKIASNLERHKVLHMESLPFCCNYCGKTFSQSDNLQLHIRTYHTHERPYLCSICGKGFVSSTRLNRHMWVHTGYKPYRCRSCPKAYSNSNDLKYHEKTHSGGVTDQDKPYVCKVCQMRFYHPCRLTKHMKTHERPYSCTVCFKTFSSNTLLNRHLASKKVHQDLDVDEDVGVSESKVVEEIFIEYQC